jgi:hypothetical protein
VRGVLKWLLLVTLLPAQMPVCMVAASEPRTPSTSAPSLPAEPHCCAKCLKKKAPARSAPTTPSTPKPEKPSKPNCACPVCSAPAAVMPDNAGLAEFDRLTVGQVTVASCLFAPDGFPSLLDRPPRA